MKTLVNPGFNRDPTVECKCSASALLPSLSHGSAKRVQVSTSSRRVPCHELRKWVITQKCSPTTLLLRAFTAVNFKPITPSDGAGHHQFCYWLEQWSLKRSRIASTSTKTQVNQRSAPRKPKPGCPRISIGLQSHATNGLRRGGLQDRHELCGKVTSSRFLGAFRSFPWTHGTPASSAYQSQSDLRQEHGARYQHALPARTAKRNISVAWRRFGRYALLLWLRHKNERLRLSTTLTTYNRLLGVAHGRRRGYGDTQRVWLG